MRVGFEVSFEDEAAVGTCAEDDGAAVAGADCTGKS